MKKLKKLTLKKETIVKLDQQDLFDSKGGYAVSTVYGNSTTEAVVCLTRGNRSIPAISHDDGPNCLSKGNS